MTRNPAPARTARAVGWAAALGTLPYLTLKAMWIGGSSAGTTDAAFLARPEVVAANAVTFALDLCVVGLALALTHSWGRRIPAWLLLLPAWVGTGLLVPMVLVVLPLTLAAPVPAGTSGFEPWVQPMVYGGFAWQGVFLVAAFTLHARTRWAGAVTTPAPARTELLRVVAGGGVVTALLCAGLHVALGGPIALFTAVAAVAGVAGVLALVRGVPARPWLAAAAAWTGSAVLFSWGLYGVLLAVTNVLPGAGGDALAGLAQLTGLLGGFSLAVAGLLAVAGQPSSTSASKQVRLPV